MHPNALPNYRPDIDGLRAVAVLSVVAFHGFPQLFPGGFVGVDIFFVISGFLISSIIFKSLSEGGFSFADFYARRAKRIFPALILVLSSSLVLGWFALFPDEFKQMGKHVFGGSAFFVNFMFWREDGYFDTAAELKPMLHLWSLGIEEQYYLLWPLFVILAWRGHINLALFLLLVGGASFALNLYRVGNASVEAFFLPHTRFWELMIGSSLAFLNSQVLDGPAFSRIRTTFLRQETNPAKFGSNSGFSALLSWTGMVSIVTGVLLIDGEKAFPGGWALFPTVGAFLLIAAGRHAPANQILLASRPMVAIGLISYPLYLWHWPLLSFTRIVASGEPPAPLRLGAVALSIALAWATYQWVEKPIRFGRRGLSVPVGLALTLGVLGFAGLTIFAKDGFLDRLEPATREFLPAPTDGAGCKNAFPFAVGHCLATPGIAEGRTWVLSLGDSHSGALAPGLVAAFPGDPGTTGLLAIGKGGCLPFRGVDDLKGGCQPLTDTALQLPSQIPVSHIIVHARWASKSSEQAGFGEIERSKPAFRYALSADFPPVDKSNNGEVFRVGLDRTLTHLETFNKPILFVHQVPELGLDPRSCWRPLSLTDAGGRHCSISRTVVDGRQRAYREIAGQVLQDHPTVMVLDPMPYFCDATSCKSESGGVPLYRDDDHLSIHGAKMLAGHIFSALGFREARPAK